ncbi:hypothetical protein [Pseudomonas sp. ES3-33]|uniref:hypothetical protein n=1 Tax=Pseudomonas sp. ES3-33 TaxID=1628833 RepID=UPI0005D418CC|nr:hypothetical protein [Pseudomonas sp. ES3-33]KJH79025.1 hypothetical protein UB23_00385 [Pseudomonas sp. ES3-33]
MVSLLFLLLASRGMGEPHRVWAEPNKVDNMEHVVEEPCSPLLRHFSKRTFKCFFLLLQYIVIKTTTKNGHHENTENKHFLDFTGTFTERLFFCIHGTLSEDGESKPGKVELYEEFSSKILGSEKWMCAITNTCADEYVPPDEINRRSIGIKAVAASLSLDQYKADFRK